MNPIQVELIQDGPAWWVPWLPTLGSFVVAAAAFVGVFLSNRTNRAAISAADEREHEKWRREEVLSAATRVLAGAADFHRLATEIGDDESVETALIDSGRAMTAAVEALAIVGSLDMFIACRDLTAAAHQCLAVRARIRAAARTIASDDEDITAATREFDEARSDLDAARQELDRTRNELASAARGELGVSPWSPAARATTSR